MHRVAGVARATRVDRRPLNGFTLVELLVVIAIIAVLIGLLFPAIQRARESARRLQCASNMRNLGLAIQHFIASNGHFPPAATTCTDPCPAGMAKHSLFSFILPYYEQGTVFAAIDFTKHWNDSANDSVTKQNLAGILICPSAPGSRESSHVTDFAPAHRIDPTSSGIGSLISASGPILPRVAGSSSPDWGNTGTPETWRPEWFGVLPLDRHPDRRRTVRPAHVRDGLSNTFMLFEDGGKPTIYKDNSPTGSTATDFRWASSTIWMTINDFCNGSQLINCDNSSKPYSFHPTGTNILFADGSMQFISESIDADTFVSLFTLRAGDSAGAY